MSTIIHAGTSQPYVPGGAERSIREQGRLLAAYRRHHGQILKDYLAGPYGPAIRAILDALKIRPDRQGNVVFDGAGFVRLLTTSEVRHAPIEIRQNVIIWISSKLGKLRIVMGLSPFDDPLAGEPAAVFQRVRELLQ
jgi:hypothetical protein